MDPNLFLTGALPFSLIVSAALTVLVAFSLLWLYRRATLRGMNEVAGISQTAPLSPDRPAAESPTRQGLTITTLDHSSDLIAKNRAHPLDRAINSALRRVALAYLLAGLAYGVVMTLAWLVNNGAPLRPTVFLWLWVCYAWPVALAINLVVALGWGQRIGIVVIYFLCVCVCVASITVAASRRSINLELGGFLFLWLFVNAPATVLLLAFLTRRVRSVGPLVLGFITVGVAGSILVSDAVVAQNTLARFFVGGAVAVGLGANSVFIFLNALGFLLFGIVIWRVLRWIGHLYQQKRMSDQALTIDAVWLVFAVVQAIPLALKGWAWFLIGLLAFGVYKLVLQVAYAKLVRPVSPATPLANLLLLRVFSLGSRSQWLFDALAKRWLRIGPISLIAGPDLVTAIVEPYEFLEFLGGHLSRQFIQSRDHLEQRLTELDLLPDPDGRFRVNELFCRADTWQMTMRRFAANSGGVLMDLRSFSPTNQGCLYELEQLLDGVLLSHIVLVIDATTDQRFLHEKLQALWAGVPSDSPNSRLLTPEIRLFRLGSSTGSEVYALLRLLVSMAPMAQKTSI